MTKEKGRIDFVVAVPSVPVPARGAEQSQQDPDGLKRTRHVEYYSTYIEGFIYLRILLN